MKIKNHITAVLLLMCILLTPALASSASAHAYDHVYNDVTVITPDSLEDVFGETEVERAAYTYEMVELSNSRAVVALEMELKIGHDYYTTIVSGTVNAYSLPSGDTLYEGPINGSMTIGEEEYRVTVGFTKVESTDDVMISTTIQGDTTMVVISFGDDVIQGEVLDLFAEKAESSQQNYLGESDIIENAIPSEFGDNQGDMVSPAMIGDGFAPIIHPGDGGGSSNLGENGEYVFQSSKTTTFEETGRIAFQSRVYWQRNDNIMAVSLKPYSGNAQYEGLAVYMDNTEFTSVTASLYSFKFLLELENSGITDGQHAYIRGAKIPSIAENTNNFTTNDDDLPEIIGRSLTFGNFPFTDDLAWLINDIRGGVVINCSDYSGSIYVNLSTPATILDELPSGVPFYFNLQEEDARLYVGNTPYTMKAYATYKYVVTYYADSLSPIYNTFYSNYMTIHTSNISLSLDNL